MVLLLAVKAGDGTQGGAIDLTREQIAAWARDAEQTLQTPIDTSIREGIHLEAAHLATLAERQCLRHLEKILRAPAQDILGTSRPRRKLFLSDDTSAFPVLRNPMQNLAAATQIADMIQHSGSATENI